MEYIHWTTHMDIGIESIDRQHYQLLECLNKLYDSVQHGHGEDALKGIVAELEVFAETHFKHEESLMAKSNYPDINDHVYRHNEFREELHEIKYKGTSLSTMLTVELLEFLKTWVKEHMMREDAKFARYIHHNAPELATEAHKTSSN